MGNRNSIVVHQPDAEPIYLYSHHHGQEIDNVVCEALLRGTSRYNDPDYFTRIVFQELVGDDNSVTGFGICATEPDHDNSNHKIHIYWLHRTTEMYIVRADVEYSPDEFISQFSRRIRLV